MNEIIENNKILYELDSEGVFILRKLSKWNKILGILFIIFGITTLLTIFFDYTNPLSVLFSILLSVFIIFIGTRLTSASSHLIYSIQEENGVSLKSGLNNLRQYFMITGILYIVLIILMIITLITGTFLGLVGNQF